MTKHIEKALDALINKRGIEATLYLSTSSEEEKTDSDLFLKRNFYDIIDKTAKYNTINPTTTLSTAGKNVKILFTDAHESESDYLYEEDTNFNTNPIAFCFINEKNINVGSVFTLRDSSTTYIVLEKIRKVGRVEITKYKVAIK